MDHWDMPYVMTCFVSRQSSERPTIPDRDGLGRSGFRRPFTDIEIAEKFFRKAARALEGARGRRAMGTQMGGGLVRGSLGKPTTSLWGG